MSCRRGRRHLRHREQDRLQLRLMPARLAPRRRHRLHQLAPHLRIQRRRVMRRRARGRVEPEARRRVPRVSVVVAVVERLLHKDLRDGREDVHHNRVDVAHEILAQDLRRGARRSRLPHAVDRLQEVAVRRVEREGELRSI